MIDDCANCRSPKVAREPVAVPSALGVRLDLAARRYIGVPFVHQGRNPDVGIDCVGLLYCAVRDCALTHLLPHDFSAYSRDPGRGELERRLLAAFGGRVYDQRPGDVVSIRFEGQARHVAIVGEGRDRLTLIHTSSNVRTGKEKGRVVEHGLTDDWRKRITGTFRVVMGDVS